MNQLTMFDTQPTETECTHQNIVEDRMPFAGWKAGELKRHCGDCFHWLDDDGNAPAVSTLEQ